jgi:hypothetical protein
MKAVGRVICVLMLVSAMASVAMAQIIGRGGSALGAFADSSCFYGYYNPARYYYWRATEVDNVLQSNRNQQAARARLPVWWTMVSDPGLWNEQLPPNPQNCDLIFTNSAGFLNSVLTYNLTGLFASMAAKGYGEVLMSLGPSGNSDPAWTNPLWTGSILGWNQQNEDVLNANINFAVNLFGYVFNRSVNRGLWVDADLGGDIIPPYDTNCQYYVPGHCGDLRYHTTYGKTAQYLVRFWDALASHSFTDGSSWFLGKDRIYGYSGGMVGRTRSLYSLYDMSSAGRPYAVVFGLYPQPATEAMAFYEYSRMNQELWSVGESGTAIISETWYDNADVARGFASAIAGTGRPVHFLIQWPLSYNPPNHTMVVPILYSNYSSYGF